jgi:hypothetical protein
MLSAKLQVSRRPEEPPVPPRADLRATVSDHKSTEGRSKEGLLLVAFRAPAVAASAVVFGA